ncbi:hypothetical protein PSE_1227 [Pseudovibrio sp. FO-BEG1]|nr:hypothetical protein PSE_1227 [Pseudovibrio sp. FO-BEG1]
MCPTNNCGHFLLPKELKWVPKVSPQTRLFNARKSFHPSA